MEVIPAIDIIGGKCVRLTQGNYDAKQEYKEEPLDMARKFEDAGLKKLHLVDLDGAKAKKIINYNVLEKIAIHTSLKIDFSGGIQTDHDLRTAFESGAKQVTVGSIAAKNPELFTEWINNFGNGRIILGADTKNGKIAVDGWQETTEKDLMEFLGYYVERDIKYALCTDVSKDGLLEGPSFQLYKDIQEQYPDLNLIASGGISSMKDLEHLRNSNIYGTVVGKAIFEGRISIDELGKFYRREI